MNQQKSFKNMRTGETPKITVAVRKRPLNRKELQRNETDIVRVGSQGQVIISEYKQKVDLTKYLQQTTFNFDYAYDEHSNNEQIYEQAVRPLIHNAFKGAKITCFAYGQTGSGKTYTMKGDLAKGVPGVYYLGAREIFNLIEQPQFQHLQVQVTFYEIYCGKLYDLLSNRNVLSIREDHKGQINVIGLNEKQICSAQEFLDVVEEGSVLRVTSQNNTNDDSSRSHAILQISLKDKKNIYSKISFIDLAGNERGADHMDQNKQTKIDGAEINKSLLSLKQCIRALDQGKSHTPFRGSKLTMVLKDSFIGYCNTIMICNVSPNVTSSENTMNTLRYADRVKELKRSDDTNEKMSKEEMMARQLMLPRANNKNCVKVNIERQDDQEDIMNKMDQARALYENFNNNQRFEEKMDIQEPYQNKKTNVPPPFGRKTENQKNEAKIFGGNDRRIVGSASYKDTIKGRSMANQPVSIRGRQLIQQNEKQPLLSRNVMPKIGQNNLNNANGGFNEFDKRNKLFNQTTSIPSSQFSLNKQHFEAMSNMRTDFVQYRQDHQMLINNEMTLVKEQLMMKNQYRQIELGGSSYEEQIENVNEYLRQMERMIRQKQELVNNMRSNFQRIKNQTKNAEALTNRLRTEQQNDFQRQQSTNIFQNGMGSQQFFGQNVTGCRSQTRLHVHSSMNALPFTGFNQYNNNYGDEQLLEGLPTDDNMTRLF